MPEDPKQEAWHGCELVQLALHRSVKSFHDVSISLWTTKHCLERVMEANDSLEIMCWYKETADKHNKDFLYRHCRWGGRYLWKIEWQFRQRSDGLGHIRLRRIDPLIGRLRKAGFLHHTCRNSQLSASQSNQLCRKSRVNTKTITEHGTPNRGRPEGH